MAVRYLGAGPYCYANSRAMMLGPDAPEPAVIEVLTGSPFGAELIGGVTPFFDPLGWDPGIGLDAAIDLLGGRAGKARAGRTSMPATCLALIGENKAADIADEQARLVGALQYPLVTG